MVTERRFREEQRAHKAERAQERRAAAVDDGKPRERQRLRAKADNLLRRIKASGFTPRELALWAGARDEAQAFAEDVAENPAKGDHCASFSHWLDCEFAAYMDEAWEYVRQDYKDMLAVIERFGKPQAKRGPRKPKP